MNYKEIREDKIFRYVWKQLSEILTINKYHGREDVQRSVKIINAVKEFAQRRRCAGIPEAKVNEWLDEELGCFKNKGYTYDEISSYYRNKVNELKKSASEALMQKALKLQMMSMEELDKNPKKSIAISKDCTKYMEAIIYIADNFNYEG